MMSKGFFREQKRMANSKRQGNGIDTFYRETQDTQNKQLGHLTTLILIPLMNCPIYGLTSGRHLLLKKVSYYITYF